VNETAICRIIEKNLDSAICAPLKYREELELYVHKPTFKQVIYESPNYSNPPFTPNLQALQSVLETLNIEDDPSVKFLRRRLQNVQDLPHRSDEWHKVDQDLSKMVSKKNTWVHKGLRYLESTAREIRDDVGTWAADWYVQTFIEHTRRTVEEGGSFTSGWKSNEVAYLFKIFDQIQLTPISRDPEAILAGISDKTKKLVSCLQAEKDEAEQNDEEYKTLVFVTRRDAVLALTEILNFHPETKDKFRVGSLVGSSDSSYRRALNDVTRKILKQSHADALEDFRQREKNVLVCTSVAEEGLDISSCGCVVRWDAPMNMVSWMQSRGRARRKRSTFITLSQTFEVQNIVMQWKQLEKTMVDRYNIPRFFGETDIDRMGSLDKAKMDANLVLRSPDTG
jgi:endoribonuclease Dicer